MTRIPTNRPPIHPREILLEDFLKPAKITQIELAKVIGMSARSVNRIVNGRRGVTPSTALRLARFFGTTSDVWLNLQLRVDLSDAMEKERRALARIQPLRAAGSR